jgi:hypothetical protein
MTTPDLPRAPLLWAAATDALWVASSEGNFMGTIELIEERYVALDGTGAPLGVNGSLAGAKDRVAAHVEAMPTIAPVRRFGAVARRMRRRRRADLVA